MGGLPLRRTAGWIAGTAVALALLLAGAPAASADAAHEADMASRVNALRASRGLGQLIVDERISSVARSWASRIGAQGSLAHNPNLGNELPPGWTDIAENTAYGPDVATMESQLENDPPHMANLLNPRFTHMGIGIVEANGRLWSVQNFASYGGGSPAAQHYSDPYSQPAYNPWTPPPAAPPPAVSPPITAASLATPVAVPPTTVPAPPAAAPLATAAPAPAAARATGQVAFTGRTTQDHVKIGAVVLLLGMLLASAANLKTSRTLLP